MKKILSFLRQNWIKYGFESFAILVGILGAITLENWNEDRQDKKELVSILGTIQSNLQTDIHKLRFTEGNSVNVIAFMDTLIDNPFDNSLAGDFILNLKLPFNPLDNSGYKIAVSNNKISLINDEQLRINITSYYESEYNNSNRFISYLFEIYTTIFNTATTPSAGLNPGCDFACRITGLLQDPSFVEMLNSYMRLYSVVLNDLEGRQESARQLIELIDTEMENY